MEGCALLGSKDQGSGIELEVSSEKCFKSELE